MKVNLPFRFLLRDMGGWYSLAGLYFDFFASLQLIAVFEPSVGGERVSRGFAPHRELPSLVHDYWILDRF